MVANITTAPSTPRVFPVTVKQLAVHPDPHLEEWFAIWLLRNFGSRIYPGIPTAKLVFWPKGEGTPDGRPIAAHEADGTLVLGTALSSLDEHRRRRSNPGIPTCSAQLVAEALNIDDDPALEEILRYLSRIDSKGGASTFDLAHIIKLIQDPELGVKPSDPREVGYWTFRAFRALYNANRRFGADSRQEWSQRAVVWEVSYPKRTYRIGEIYSATRDIQRVGRFWGRCDVVIQHGPRNPGCGNSQVYVTQKIQLPLSHRQHLEKNLGGDVLRSLRSEVEGLIDRAKARGMEELLRSTSDFIQQQYDQPDVYWLIAEVCRIFRLEELRYRGINGMNAHESSLWAEGSLRDRGRPEFFLYRRPGWLFNGSTSAPNVPVSCIPIRPNRTDDPSPWVKLVYCSLVSPWNRKAIKLVPAKPLPSQPLPTAADPPPPTAAE